jgi:hypothetical protein
VTEPLWLLEGFAGWVEHGGRGPVVPVEGISPSAVLRSTPADFYGQHNSSAYALSRRLVSGLLERRPEVMRRVFGGKKMELMMTFEELKRFGEEEMNR